MTDKEFIEQTALTKLLDRVRADYKEENNENDNTDNGSDA